MLTTADESYWAEYNNFQQVKHDLIRDYLNGWFPKLGLTMPKILYLDTHAGRGKHETGQLGSPLVALETFLNHSHRDTILRRCSVHFVFIEKDDENLAALRQELAELGDLPGNVQVDTYGEDAFAVLGEVSKELEATGKALAPAFIFVDPYGFKVPCSVLRALMQSRACELFVNVIWRELHMAIMQAKPPAGLLTTVFGSDDWRGLRKIADSDRCADSAVDVLGRSIGAKWATYVRMTSGGSATRYFLLHLTNHRAGRDLMKSVLWTVCPDGGFYVRKHVDRRQQLLIKPEPDLEPLRQWVIERLEETPRHWQDLQELLRDEVWLNKHLGEMIRQLKKQGAIEATNYAGKFSATQNPLLTLKGA